MNISLSDTRSIPLYEGWLFSLEASEESYQKDAPEEGFSPVTLPHDWSVTLPFERGNSSGTGYASGGTGWYRCHFPTPPGSAGGRFRLTFDGVYKHARVWINSSCLGFHANGFTSFSYDVTPWLAPEGADNVVAVRVDHTELSDCRWYTGSGINRKVTLTCLPPVSPAEYGVFFTVTEADAGRAVFHIETSLENHTGEPFEGILIHRLYAPGEEVEKTELRQDVSLPANGKATVTLEGSLASPLLWSPDTPFLYTLKTLLAEGGKEALLQTDPVGIRTFRFDPDHGFFLNGQPVKLKGVCLHDDCGALGTAATKEIWYRRLAALREAGCNALRMSHNPHMPELYDLCDELGFLVMDEAFDEWEAPKNKWSTGHNVYPPKHQGYAVHFPQCHEEDLRGMILRDRNHPCVILWSIGNEIDYPNDPYCHPMFQEMTGNNDANKPAAERLYNPDKPGAERLRDLASMLAGEVRSLDQSHPVTLAAAFPELSARIGFLDALDVAGYNYKEALYEESHLAFPRLPFLGSENSHSLEAWTAVRDREYISGQFLWTGIDYLGEAHGWPVRASGSGILSLAGFPKPGYYRRASFWTEKPMAHLVTARPSDGPEWCRPFLENWNYQPGEEVEVRCYTTLPQAELFLNGRSLGTASRKEQEDSIRWSVPFQPGTLQVRAFGKTPDSSGEPLSGACDRGRASCGKSQETAKNDNLSQEMCGRVRTDRGKPQETVEKGNPSPEACDLRPDFPVSAFCLSVEKDKPSPEACGAIEAACGKAGTAAEETGPFPEAYDRIETVYAPSALRLSHYEVPREYWQTSRPVLQVEISVCDLAGRLVRTGSEKIHVQVQGGVLLGLESGDIADITEYRSPVRASWQGHLLAYVRRDPPAAPLTVTATSDALGTASLII